MSKRTKAEIIIAAILLLVEVIVILACRFGDAMNAESVDVYMTSIIAIFINIDVFYVIALQIINSNHKDN